MAQMTTVDQARHKILQMAREIEQLAQSSVPPEQFFRRFLQLLVAALGSRAGVVWMVGNGGMLNRFCDISLSETNLDGDPEALRRNQRLLVEVISDGQARSYNPSDDRGVELPTPHHIILAPLQNGTESVGVVEIFQRADCPVEARPGYLQFIEQMCGYASKYLERPKDLPAAPRSDGFLDEFARFTLSLQRSLKLKEVASTAANDGRQLLKCDRLSVAMQRGRKVVIQSISGQDAVNQRANLVRAMSKLARQVVRGGEPLMFTGKVEGLPPQVEQPLAEYVHESGSRMVAVIPLDEPQRVFERRDEQETGLRVEQRPRRLGCLVAEQINDSTPPAAFRERIDLIADHVAASLANARSHQRVFLLPVWKAIGRTKEWFHGRKLLKTLAILAILGGIVGSLALIPKEYRVEGEGRLMPVLQKEAFAPIDGEVQSIFVEGGQVVQAGQKLIQLRSDELDELLNNAETEIAEKLKELGAIRARMEAAERSDDDNEAYALSGQYYETGIAIQGLRERIARYERRIDELTITAPIDGVVATFQLEQKLLGRPVSRGQILLEVMDPRGDWRLELEVEEHRLGHILRAQAAQNKQDLLVEYILATRPETTYEGRLADIASRPVPSGDGGVVLEVFTTIERDKLPPDRRIGSEVIAKIHCGKKSLGYALFGDVVEFVQKFFWL